MDSSSSDLIDKEFYLYLEYFSPFFAVDRNHSFPRIHNSYIRYIADKYAKEAGLDDYARWYRILDIMKQVQQQQKKKKKKTTKNKGEDRQHWIMNMYLG